MAQPLNFQQAILKLHEYWAAQGCVIWEPYNVQVGEECLIGAGALLTQGKVFPPRSVILGSPAKVVREVTDADLLMIAHGAEHYVQKAKEYRG